jgi:nucleoside-diphosphate-sugar epimerase
MTRRYLVTGGLGFLGSSLTRKLAERGDFVRVLDDASRGSRARLTGVRFELFDGDVRDPATVAGACRDVDAVCHLAFVNGTELFYSKPELVLDVGVRGMMNVIDGCRAAGVRELLLMSSSEVYQTPPMIPTPEDVPLTIPDAMNPRYSYAAGKIISEIVAINYGRTGFDRVLIVRPHNVYGPDMGWEHVIPQFTTRLARLARTQPDGELALPIQGSGRESRAFVYVDDFIRGVLCVLDRGEHMNIYHIGTADEIEIAGLAREIGAVLGRSVSIRPGPPAVGGTLRRCPDIAKARGLGYEPTISLPDGLSKTVPWYVSHSDHEPERTNG